MTPGEFNVTDERDTVQPAIHHCNYDCGRVECSVEFLRAVGNANYRDDCHTGFDKARPRAY